jgi:hypothetical protein
MRTSLRASESNFGYLHYGKGCSTVQEEGPLLRLVISPYGGVEGHCLRKSLSSRRKIVEKLIVEMIFD